MKNNIKEHDQFLCWNNDGAIILSEIVKEKNDGEETGRFVSEELYRLQVSPMEKRCSRSPGVIDEEALTEYLVGMPDKLLIYSVIDKVEKDIEEEIASMKTRIAKLQHGLDSLDAMSLEVREVVTSEDEKLKKKLQEKEFRWADVLQHHVDITYLLQK